eukprot:5322970-Amphidinium_carterae.1
MRNTNCRLNDHSDMQMAIMATDSEDSCGIACNIICIAFGCTSMVCKLPMIQLKLTLMCHLIIIV